MGPAVDRPSTFTGSGSADAAVDSDNAAGMRAIVIASSVGTTFEWYDFFVFGSLTQVISKTFFSGLNETAGYIAALACSARASPSGRWARWCSAGSATGWAARAPS